MLLGAGYGLGELMRPFQYSTDIYSKEYKDLKSRGGNVDMVLLGASRILVSLDPEVFKEKFKLNSVFNLSVSQLSVEGMYYQLKEFVEEFHPKYVVLGIAEGSLTYTKVPKITKLRLLERLHGKNWLEYIRNSLTPSDYPYLIPLYSYRSDLAGIHSNIQSKKQFEKEGIHMKTAKWQFKGNGFVVYHKSVPQGNIGAMPVSKFDESMVSDTTRHYLDQCVKLCKDNNIQLIFMTPPTSMSHIYSISNFQDVIDYITNYARENNIPYRNMNYLKGKEKLFPDSTMYDYKHLNKQGAAIVSEKYAEILAKDLQGIDTRDYFYTSLDELKKTVDRVVGVYAKPVIKNNIMRLSVRSLQNQGITPSYEVLLGNRKNEFKTIVDWTGIKDISFKIPKGKPYRILLRARHKKDAAEYAWMAWEIDARGRVKKVDNIPIRFYKL